MPTPEMDSHNAEPDQSLRPTSVTGVAASSVHTSAVVDASENLERVFVGGVVADVNGEHVVRGVETECLQQPHERLALVPINLRLEFVHHLALVASTITRICETQDRHNQFHRHRFALDLRVLAERLVRNGRNARVFLRRNVSTIATECQQLQEALESPAWKHVPVVQGDRVHIVLNCSARDIGNLLLQCVADLLQMRQEVHRNLVLDGRVVWPDDIKAVATGVIELRDAHELLDLAERAAADHARDKPLTQALKRRTHLQRHAGAGRIADDRSQRAVIVQEDDESPVAHV